MLTKCDGSHSFLSTRKRAAFLFILKLELKILLSQNQNQNHKYFIRIFYLNSLNDSIGIKK